MVEFGMMLTALGLLQLLVLREWRRLGWQSAAAAAGAWFTTGVAGSVRAAITEVPAPDAYRDMAIVYVLVCIISAGRPILVMTDFFDEGELTRGERRRGHAIQGLLIVALGIWTLSSG